MSGLGEKTAAVLSRTLSRSCDWVVDVAERCPVAAPAVAFFALLAFIAGILAWAGGCSAAKPAEAQASYLVQQLECVDKYDTRAEIDLCRKLVRGRWARDAGPVVDASPRGDDGGAP